MIVVLLVSFVSGFARGIKIMKFADLTRTFAIGVEDGSCFCKKFRSHIFHSDLITVISYATLSSQI